MSFHTLQHTPWCGLWLGSGNNENTSSKESEQVAFEMPEFSDQSTLYSAVMINALLTSRLDLSPIGEHLCHTQRKDSSLSFGIGPSY